MKLCLSLEIQPTAGIICPETQAWLPSDTTAQVSAFRPIHSMCKNASEAQSTFALPLTSAFDLSGLHVCFPPASSLYGSCAVWVEASRSVAPLLNKVKHD